MPVSTVNKAIHIVSLSNNALCPLPKPIVFPQHPNQSCGICKTREKYLNNHVGNGCHDGNSRCFPYKTYPEEAKVEAGIFCPLFSKERHPNMNDSDRRCDSPATRKHFLAHHTGPCHNGECLAGKAYPEMRREETSLRTREKRYSVG